MEVRRFIGRTLKFHPVVPWSYILGLNIIIREINQSLSDVSLSFLITFWKRKGGIVHLAQYPSLWIGQEQRGKINWQSKLLQASKPELFLRNATEKVLLPSLRWRKRFREASWLYPHEKNMVVLEYELTYAVFQRLCT